MTMYQVQIIVVCLCPPGILHVVYIIMPNGDEKIVTLTHVRRNPQKQERDMVFYTAWQDKSDVS